MNDIRIFYLIKFFCSISFWAPVWVLFYLRFTDYSGVVILDVAWVTAIAVFEIPTGALADLIGKKKTIALSFLLFTFVFVAFAFSANFTHIFISMIGFALAEALLSGAFDALVYDSLVERGQQDKYSEVIMKTSRLELVALSIGALFGGIFYTIDPKLPFILNALEFVIALGLLYWIKEPRVDTYKFSFKNYLRQTSKGLSNLFANSHISRTVIFILIISIFYTIGFEFLSDVLFVDFGFEAKELGLVYAGVFMINALLIKVSVNISRKLKPLWGIFWISIPFALSYVLTPFIGMWVFVGLNLLRLVIYSLRKNLTLEYINKLTESNTRATTLSSFSMLNVTGYALVAFVSSWFIKYISLREYAALVGFLLLLFLFSSLTIKSILKYNKN